MNDANNQQNNLNNIQRQANFDPYTGKPIQQMRFDPYTGRPLQQMNFDPHTGRPIQQMNFNPHTGKPIQQMNFDPKTGRPIEKSAPQISAQSSMPQQRNFDPGTGRPVEKSAPQNRGESPKPKKKKGKKKTFLRVGACLLATIVLIASVSVVILNMGFSKSQAHIIDASIDTSNNSVDFRNSVAVITDTDSIQKNILTTSFNDNVYTLSYSELPDDFKSLKKDAVFCVYPDSSSDNEFFKSGFCGKVVENNTDGELSFTIPTVTEVFSDINFELKEGSSNLSSASFVPNENMIRCNIITATKTPLVHNGSILPVSGAQGFTLGDGSPVKFTYKSPSQSSLKDDYVMVCDSMKLDFDLNLPDSDGLETKLSGDITVEDLAIKMALDYHYNEETGEVDIYDYALGMISKQKANLKLSGEKEFSLDDFSFDASPDLIPIEFEDVTSSEKGKVILGTYLFGYEAALPVIGETDNGVSPLSLGLAVQLALTATGKLTLALDMESSGFTYVEVAKDTEPVYMIKGYDYPHPAVDGTLPSYSQEESLPETSAAMSCDVEVDAAVGVDLGLCILGMVPMKLATNVVELNLEAGISTDDFNTNGISNDFDVIEENLVVSDFVDFAKLSTNSTFKFNVGAKINIGKDDINLGSIGAEILLYDTVHYQYPPTDGFTHAECNFAGVQLGEYYTTDELEQAINAYLEKSGQNTFVSEMASAAFENAAQSIMQEMGLGSMDIMSFINENIDNYQIDFFSPGLCVLRNDNNQVVAMMILSGKIANPSQLHTGSSYRAVEKLYSTPNEEGSMEIDLGDYEILAQLVPELKDIAGQFTAASYISKEGTDELLLLFSNDSLKIILAAYEE